MSGTATGSAWDERVFPGWALLITPWNLVGSLDAGIIVMAALFGALVPFVVLRLTNDEGVAFASSVLPPVWIMQSSLGMSEPAYLFFVLAAILFAIRGNVTLGGILMGFAALIRPTALFPWLGVFVYLLATSDNRRLIIKWVFWSGLVASLTLAINFALYGAPFRQLQQYANLPNISESAQVSGLSSGGYGHLGFPFKALVLTPFFLQVPLWKVFYIWGNAIFVLWASVRAYTSWKSGGLSTVFAIWAITNTAFIVSTGPYWGFHSFDRYALWAMPAYLYFFREFLPKQTSRWVAIATLSTLFALRPVLRGA
ncbi:MAG: hypothetical protein ABL967_11170 [Bryobacteraceae bacterium]